MGEARRRQLAAQRLQAPLEAAVARVSPVLRKIARACHPHFGSDCRWHAQLAHRLLKEAGFETQYAVGIATWRVGDGNGDLIAHLPTRDTVYLPAAATQGTALFGHIWLTCADYLIDCTTYQLRHKGQLLDATDGSTTDVRWCPDYLVLNVKDIQSLHAVRTASRAGMAHYEADPELKALATAENVLDPLDLITAPKLLANPALKIFGRNDGWVPEDDPLADAPATPGP